MSTGVGVVDALGREPDDDPDVADLVWRLSAGERSAIAEAYDRHGDALRGFARRLLGEHAAAEDLVHDVFLTLPKTVRKFEGRSSLRTFLISVAVNRCRHHLRAAARYRRTQERYADQPARRGDPGPLERLEQREMAMKLACSLDTLPTDQRVAFVLAVIEGRSSAEVALIMGVAEATVRTRVLRARTKLRGVLSEERSDG